MSGSCSQVMASLLSIGMCSEEAEEEDSPSTTSTTSTIVPATSTTVPEVRGCRQRKL